VLIYLQFAFDTKFKNTLFNLNNLQDKVLKWRETRSWHCELKSCVGSCRSCNWERLDLKRNCERLLTYYGLNNDCESETEDNGEDGLSVTSAETTINRPNAQVGLKD